MYHLTPLIMSKTRQSISRVHDLTEFKELKRAQDIHYQFLYFCGELLKEETVTTQVGLISFEDLVNIYQRHQPAVERKSIERARDYLLRTGMLSGSFGFFKVTEEGWDMLEYEEEGMTT